MRGTCSSPKGPPDSALRDLQHFLEWNDNLAWSTKGDTLSWFDGGNNFSVRLCYKKLLQIRLRLFNHEVLSLNWSRVWHPGIPSNMNFFTWLLMRQRTLTQANLKRGGFYLAERFALCMKNIEDENHLFFVCELIAQVW